MFFKLQKLFNSKQNQKRRFGEKTKNNVMSSTLKFQND